MQYNTLWISDLDGTLLNSEKRITDTTKNILNKAIEKGVHFSVATARTPATVVDMLQGINVNVPAVVMNGAAIYNLEKQHYERVVCMEPRLVKKIQDILDKENKNAFIYCIEEDKLVAHYKTLENSYEEEFFNERQNNPRKTFKQGMPSENAKVVHFSIIGEKERIEKIQLQIKEIKGLAQICSTDVYNESIYYLEVYSENVSKAAAIQYLKETYDFNKVICFGDNLNDIPMFEMADEKYAVANALEEVKLLCTAVIGHNNEDGVAKFIEANSQK